MPSISGMERRKPAIIIKEIIYVLREGPLALRAIESKVDTNNKTIRIDNEIYYDP